MKTTWKIGPSHIEAKAQVLQGDAEFEWLDAPLATLPLSVTKSGGGIKLAPVRSEGMRLHLIVTTEFYFAHINGHRTMYVWMSEQTDDKVISQWCNRFIVTRRKDRAGEDAISVYLESSFRKTFATVDELLRSQEARPEGDFVNHNCGCYGSRTGFRDWLRRVFRRSPYVYALSVTDSTETKQFDDVRVRPPLFLVTRVTRDGRLDWQCACGAWTEIDPHDRGREHMTLHAFRDSRSAHDYVRRLRNGVPQNWELVVAFSSVISAIAFVIGEVVIPLCTSAG